jgi:phenylalanyl-tRNA synthetase alpha chain
MEKETKIGHVHIITQVINRINTILFEMGFSHVDGPEIEDDYHNFDALNVPKDHPARDMQDTFWLKSGLLMRTHTSPVQIRYMEKNNKPPFQIVSTGKTFRKEATDATHEMQFQQFEGLFVDKNVSLATLKSVLNAFFDKFFEKNIDVRFRPSFFPFVEPGAEVDISCFKCKGEVGCPVCKGTGWIEVMGAGLVHPAVLDRMGIDSKTWSGFAFGGSVERLAMLKYGITDIRLFYSGDLRLVNQF